MTLKKIYFLVLFLITFFSVHGQLVTNTENYLLNVQSFSTEDGLSHNAVNDFTQDAYGFMWLATPDGLNRYDGQEFKVYKKKKNGLNRNNVRRLCSTPDSLLWLFYPNSMGIYSTVDVFNPITGQATPFKTYYQTKEIPFSISDLDGNRLRAHPDGSLWFGSIRQLFNYDGNTFKTILTVPDSLILVDFLPINSPNYQGGWAQLESNIGLEKSVYLLFFDENGKSIEKTLITSNSIIKGINLIKTTAAGEIIYNVNYYNESSQKRQLRHSEVYKKTPLGEIKIVKHADKEHEIYYYNPVNQEIWCTGDSSYISILDTSGQHIITTNIYTHKVISNYFIDRQGGFWYNLNRKTYLISLGPNLFQQFTCPQNKKKFAKGSRGITENASGGFFINSREGTYYAPNRTQEMKRLPPIPNYPRNLWGRRGGLRLALLAEDSDNSVWLTGEYQTLIRYWPTSSTYAYYIYDSLDDAWMRTNKVSPLNWSLFKDKNKRIWLGTTGLSYLDQDAGVLRHIKDYNGFDGLSKSTVFHFYSNQQGVWLATSTGLYLLNEEMLVRQHFHNKGDSTHFLPCKVVSHLQEDKDGIFWLTTKGNGLIRWNPKTGEYKQFTQDDGLTNDILYAVYEDDYNNLWLSSNQGIMCFNKETYLIKSYFSKDGLPQEEFNTISHYKAKDGTLFFGGINGVISFHPRTFENASSKIPSPLRIVSFTKYNQEKSKTINLTAFCFTQKQINIYPDERNVLLKFTLLDYQTESINYAYKIEGIDKDWHYIPKGELYLDGLPYGNYKIRIKTENVSTELNILLTVHAPYYLQTWFILFCIFILILSVFIIIKLRVRRLQQRQKELELIVQKRTQELQQKTTLLETQADDLKALDRLKSRFFTNISHELRTPLTLILGPLASLIKNKQIQATEKRQLHMIERSGKQLLHLVEEILDLSKMDANKLEVEEKTTSLKTFVNRVYSNFEAQATFQNINFSLDIQLENDVTVLLDQNKVEKILNNFMSNALKFTPAKQKIIASVWLKDDKIYFSVMDTGIGIANEDTAYVFERFYQGKNQTSKGGGTGVGLAFCKELAELMEASVEVDSKLKKGSTFTFILPAKVVETPIKKIIELEQECSESIQDEKYSSNPSLEKQDYSILLVEDNQDMQFYIQNLLEPYYKVITCNNGQIAHDYLMNSNNILPNLIVSDVMMPLMDGFTLLKYCKKDKRLSSIPIIMLTARSSIEDKLNALTIGVDDYLIKPFLVEELLARVQNLLIHAQGRIIKEIPEESGPVEQGENDIPKISELDQNWIKNMEQELLTIVDDPDFNVDAFAEKMQTSRRSLYRRLKKVTGLTPAQYIREIRLQLARDMLERGLYKTVSEVAYASGFSTPYHFTRLYHKRFGKKAVSYFKG